MKQDQQLQDKESDRKTETIFDIKKIKQSVLKLDVSRHKRKPGRKYFITGIRGLDSLFEFGIPEGSRVIVAGGSGSGKTLLCLHILANAAKKGKKCLFMSFEEAEERLKEHMEDMGFQTEKLEKSGKLVIKRFSSFDVSRSIEAMLAKSRGELYIDIKPVILPKGFSPDVIVIDSLSSIASVFSGRRSNYRTYIEQLFRYLEDIGATSFLITETEQVPKTFSPTGVEAFLADGVIVLYNIRKGDTRERAIEVLKMRGAQHKRSLVAMQIISGVGIEVYPEQSVLSDIE